MTRFSDTRKEEEESSLVCGCSRLQDATATFTTNGSVNFTAKNVRNSPLTFYDSRDVQASLSCKQYCDVTSELGHNSSRDRGPRQSRGCSFGCSGFRLVFVFILLHLLAIVQDVESQQIILTPEMYVCSPTPSPLPFHIPPPPSSSPSLTSHLILLIH